MDTRIEAFEKQLLIPLYEEICTSSRLLAKGRLLKIERGETSPDVVTSEALKMMAGGRKTGESMGPTLVMIEDPKHTAGFSHPQAGRFYLRPLYRRQGEQILASPWVMYWMRFNDKMHAFAHRYDNNVADHGIEKLTRKELVNHALGAISGFDVYAFSEKRPF